MPCYRIEILLYSIDDVLWQYSFSLTLATIAFHRLTLCKPPVSCNENNGYQPAVLYINDCVQTKTILLN